MKVKYLFLGMATQACMAGFLDLFGLITLSAGQQLSAGAIFILGAALVAGQSKQKKQPEQ